MSTFTTRDGTRIFYKDWGEGQPGSGTVSGLGASPDGLLREFPRALELAACDGLGNLAPEDLKRARDGFTQQQRPAPHMRPISREKRCGGCARWAESQFLRFRGSEPLRLRATSAKRCFIGGHRWGASGRWFKSSRPDHLNAPELLAIRDGSGACSSWHFQVVQVVRGSSFDGSGDFFFSGSVSTACYGTWLPDGASVARQSTAAVAASNQTIGNIAL